MRCDLLFFVCSFIVYAFDECVSYVCVGAWLRVFVCVVAFVFVVGFVFVFVFRVGVCAMCVCVVWVLCLCLCLCVCLCVLRLRLCCCVCGCVCVRACAWLRVCECLVVFVVFGWFGLAGVGWFCVFRVCV